MSALFPVLIDIKGKKCVVIGGGVVAERKIKTLLKYGAHITVISPKITKSIEKLIQSNKISHIKKLYEKDDLKDALIVVAATSDRSVNEQIVRDAKFLVNNVEKGEDYIKTNNIKYIVPAILQKEELTIAISSEFPALSRTIREEIKKYYGKEFALYIRYLKKLRRELKKKISDTKKRRKIFREIASKEIVSILRQYGFKKAKEEIDRIINAS